MFFNEIYYGNSLKSWAISAGIILGALIINKIIAIVLHRIGTQNTARTGNTLFATILNSIQRPLLFGIALFAIWAAIMRLHFAGDLKSSIFKIYGFLSVLNVTWLFVRVFSGVITEYFQNGFAGKKPSLDIRFLPMLKRIVVILIWLFGCITALHNIGIQLTTVFGALGVGGLATALAAQDTVKNIFGGFTILADKSFKIGDVICIDGKEGTVEDIGIRSTRLRLYDRRLVLIPNGKMIDAMVLNISSEPERRVLMELGLTYNTTPEKMREAMEILQKIAHETAGVEKKDVVTVFSAFGDSALIIKFIYYIKKNENYLQVSSVVNLAILEQFNAAGLDFAFPTQTICIQK